MPFDPSDLLPLSGWDYIGHLSYLLLAASFLLRDILGLRIVAISAAIANITWAYHGAAGPNWIAIFWQATFMLINLGWSMVLIRERSSVHFTEEERELHETIFRNFSPVEFLKLMRLAQWRQVAVGVRLATRGQRLDDVLLIYNGEVEVHTDGEARARLRDGAFIGEMSFLRGGPATADVVTVVATRVVGFPKAALRALLDRNPAMGATLSAVFGQDLTNKLLRDDAHLHPRPHPRA